MIPLHHDAMMRTTLDLPEDLHRIVSSLASHSRSSMSQTAADLIRRGLSLPGKGGPSLTISTNPVTGLPLIKSRRTITPEDVKSLEDE
jgi:hypothetical protein